MTLGKVWGIKQASAGGNCIRLHIHDTREPQWSGTVSSRPNSKVSGWEGERKRMTSITSPDSNKSLLLLALGASGSTASPVGDKDLLQILFAKPEPHTARSERIETVWHIIVA